MEVIQNIELIIAAIFIIVAIIYNIRFRQNKAEYLNVLFIASYFDIHLWIIGSNPAIYSTLLAYMVTFPISIILLLFLKVSKVQITISTILLSILISFLPPSFSYDLLQKIVPVSIGVFVISFFSLYAKMFKKLKDVSIDNLFYFLLANLILCSIIASMSWFQIIEFSKAVWHTFMWTFLFFNILIRFMFTSKLIYDFKR